MCARIVHTRWGACRRRVFAWAGGEWGGRMRCACERRASAVFAGSGAPGRGQNAKSFCIATHVESELTFGQRSQNASRLEESHDLSASRAVCKSVGAWLQICKQKWLTNIQLKRTWADLKEDCENPAETVILAERGGPVTLVCHALLVNHMRWRHACTQEPRRETALGLVGRTGSCYLNKQTILKQTEAGAERRS